MTVSEQSPASLMTGTRERDYDEEPEQVSRGPWWIEADYFDDGEHEMTDCDDSRPLTEQEMAIIDSGYEFVAASTVVAVVVDDNQPGRRFVAETVGNSMTLEKGTELFIAPASLREILCALAAAEHFARTEVDRRTPESHAEYHRYMDRVAALKKRLGRSGDGWRYEKW